MSVDDGNDLAAIDAALQAARAETARPSLILVRTHIGYGSPEQDSFKAHGSPLGADDVRQDQAERSAGRSSRRSSFPTRRWRTSARRSARGARAEAAWNARMARLREGVSRARRASCERACAASCRRAGTRTFPIFPADAKGMATRVASRQGDERDRAEAAGADRRLGRPRSVDAHRAEGPGRLQSAAATGEDAQGSDGGGWSYAGRNLHFGVREHAMGAIVNGLAAHGGFIPYGATFLIFSDYMRPPIRLAALMGLHVVHVFTHDSIALGEDGPTHQPVEQLASLRAIPNLTRDPPRRRQRDRGRLAGGARNARSAGAAGADAPGRADARPQPLCASADGLRRGAYVLSERRTASPRLILIASGSEVGLIVAAAERLQRRRHRGALRLDAELGAVRRAAAELSRRGAAAGGDARGWRSKRASRRAGIATSATRGDMLGVDRFGASAPADDAAAANTASPSTTSARARKALLASAPAAASMCGTGLMEERLRWVL